MFLSYRNAAELLNFGAFLAFMAVNIATIRQFWFKPQNRADRNIIYDIFLPAAGFLFCFSIWISLPSPAKIIGGLWFVAGFIYLVIKTKGFRLKPVILDLTEGGMEEKVK
jgi:amino acid transporter